jgi:hypothetical protein
MASVVYRWQLQIIRTTLSADLWQTKQFLTKNFSFEAVGGSTAVMNAVKFEL